MLEYSRADSPVVSDSWAALETSVRVGLVARALSQNEKFRCLLPTQARDDGQVFVSLEEPLGAGERGIILRAAEALLKDQIDVGITLWCEPLGDKNSLRKLRGIEVRS